MITSGSRKTDRDLKYFVQVSWRTSCSATLQRKWVLFYFLVWGNRAKNVMKCGELYFEETSKETTNMTREPHQSAFLPFCRPPGAQKPHYRQGGDPFC